MAVPAKPVSAGLPRLRVTAIDKDGFSVSFSEGNRREECGLACIILASGKVLWGRFTSVDTQKREARFIPDNHEETSALRTDEEYDYLDGYWGQRAELVLDRARKWTRAEFKPSDAVAFEVKGQSISGKWGSSLFEGAEAIHRVPGGWTHEHCEICWETIGPSGRNTGYRDQNDQWVCESCYDSYVVSKKLGFIPG